MGMDNRKTSGGSFVAALVFFVMTASIAIFLLLTALVVWLSEVTGSFILSSLIVGGFFAVLAAVIYLLAIREGVEQGRKWGDFAVLYRNNVLSDNIAAAFIRAGIPYRVYKGRDFFSRAEVKDMFAYLWVIENPADELRLRRIINTPAARLAISRSKPPCGLPSSMAQHCMMWYAMPLSTLPCPAVPRQWRSSAR